MLRSSLLRLCLGLPGLHVPSQVGLGFTSYWVYARPGSNGLDALLALPRSGSRTCGPAHTCPLGLHYYFISELHTFCFLSPTLPVLPFWLLIGCMGLPMMISESLEGQGSQVHPHLYGCEWGYLHFGQCEESHRVLLAFQSVMKSGWPVGCPREF